MNQHIRIALERLCAWTIAQRTTRVGIHARTSDYHTVSYHTIPRYRYSMSRPSHSFCHNTSARERRPSYRRASIEECVLLFSRTSQLQSPLTNTYWSSSLNALSLAITEHFHIFVCFQKFFKPKAHYVTPHSVGT